MFKQNARSRRNRNQFCQGTISHLVFSYCINFAYLVKSSNKKGFAIPYIFLSLFYVIYSEYFVEIKGQYVAVPKTYISYQNIF